MNLRRLFFILFLFSFGLILQVQVSAQDRIIDSLKRSLTEPQHDTVRAAKLDLISFYYQTVNPDSGLLYGQKSLDLSEKADWKRGQILALMELSNNYRAKSLFAEGIEKGEMALTLLKSEEMPAVEMAVLANISLLYKDLDYPGKALEYLLQALELENRSDKKQNLPVILENIGSIYLDQDDYYRADSLYDQALTMHLERGDSAGLSRNLTNKARIEQKRNNTEKAIVLFKQALEISLNGGRLNSIQVIYSNLGIAHANLKNYDSAIFYHRKALLISEKLNMERSIAINSGNLGQAWFNKAQDSVRLVTGKEKRLWMDQAELHLQKACNMAFSSNFRGPYLEFSEYLTQLLLERGQFKEAAAILGNRLVVMKQVNEEEEKIKMVKVESHRLLESKQLEIEQNKKDLEISELKLGLEKRNVLTIILIFVFLTTLGIVLMLYLKKRGDYHKAILRNISLSHSHEIRGPLARIMGLADLLKNDLLEEKDKDYIYKSIEESAKELDRNISDIIYKSSHKEE